MPNIAKILKDEIQRLARKEVAQQVTALKKGTVSLKKNIAEHKRRIAALEKENRALAKKIPAEQAEHRNEDAAAEELRVTAKSLKSMRSRLDITQAELAKLLGVSVQSVSGWETKEGRLQIRKAESCTALAALRREKKAQVHARLGKQPKSKPAALPAPPEKKAGRGDGGLTGAAIAQARERLGLSQQAFAALAGVSNQIVSVWENRQGPLKLRAKTAEALAKVLKISKAEARRRLEQ